MLPLMKRCLSPICERPFQINRFGKRLGTVQGGMLTCQHCELSMQGEGESIFLAYAWLPEEEKE